MLSREDIDVLRDRLFTWKQKANYLKYRLSSPGATLSYQPITISVVATNLCTLACDMCPTHSRFIPRDYPHIQQPTKDISFDMLKAALEKFDRALNVQIIGSGEPLLNKDFFRMVEYAHTTKHMRVKTFTNGTTIDANIDNILNSSLDGITVSLNGHTEQEFRRMTGCPEGVYDKIRRATRDLISRRNARRSSVRINLAFIIDRANYAHIPSIVDAGRSLGADSIFLCNFLPSPYKAFTSEERMLFIDDPEMVKRLKEIYEGLDKEARRITSFPLVIDKNLAKNRCNAHFVQARVDGEGRISSCSVMLLNMEGKGYFQDEDAWNNEFFKEMRRIFLANDKELLFSPCRICPENFGVKAHE